MFMVLCIADLY